VREQKRLISAPECKLVFNLDSFEEIEAMVLTWQRTIVPETSAPQASPLNALGGPLSPFYVPASPLRPAAHLPRAPGYYTLTPLLSNMVASSTSTTARTPATSVRAPTPMNASSPQLVKSLKRKAEATPSANKRPRRPTVRDSWMTPQQIQQGQQQAAMQQQLNAQRIAAAAAAPCVTQIRQQVDISQQQQQQQQRASTPTSAAATASMQYALCLSASAAAAIAATIPVTPHQYALWQRLSNQLKAAGVAGPLAGALNGLAAP
jgi:predicted RNA-binding Zn ribbon-like protein